MHSLLRCPDADPTLCLAHKHLWALSRTPAGSASGHGVKPLSCCAGFYGYGGEGFSLLLPSQWNPSKEREEPGVVLRYEDNGDSLNNVVVVARKSDKNSIEGYGSPDDFLNKISPLLGEQVFSGTPGLLVSCVSPGLNTCCAFHRLASALE